MQIVLKFLYTGRLGITEDVKNIVRELLEDILQIDAKIRDQYYKTYFCSWLQYQKELRYFDVWFDICS